MKIRTTHPTAIIARMHENKIMTFYPDGNVTECKNDLHVRREIVNNVNNWLIADAVLPQSEGTFCRTVLVTSPGLAGFNRHKKQGFEERCMPVWDLSELKTVHSKVYSGQGDWEDVERSFELWGGVPRMTLRFGNSDSWERELLSMLNSTQIKQCMRFDGELSYSSIDNVSGKLVHLVPVDDKYIFTQVRWASQKLCNLVLDLLIAVEKAKKQILSTREIWAYGSLRGHLFENLAYRIICAGGVFQVRSKPTARLA